MVGIIGAMSVEIENIKHLMINIKTESIAHINFYYGKINNTECVIAVSGVGKVNAAICTQIMISKFSPDLILNVGVAGALKDDIKIGDIVISDYVVQHDMDTCAVGDEKGFISGINMIKIPCSKKLNEKIIASASKTNKHVHVGTIATGDQFIASKEKLLDIRNTFDASACEMEAASISQVCYVNGTEFTALRIISDNANHDSHIDYNKFKSIIGKEISQIINHFVSLI